MKQQAPTSKPAPATHEQQASKPPSGYLPHDPPLAGFVQPGKQIIRRRPGQRDSEGQRLAVPDVVQPPAGSGEFAVDEAFQGVGPLSPTGTQEPGRDRHMGAGIGRLNEAGPRRQTLMPEQAGQGHVPVARPAVFEEIYVDLHRAEGEI